MHQRMKKKNATKVVSFLIHRQLIPPNSFHLPSHPRHSCSHSLAHFLRSLSLSWHHCSTRYIIGKKFNQLQGRKWTRRRKRTKNSCGKFSNLQKTLTGKCKHFLLRSWNQGKVLSELIWKCQDHDKDDQQNPLFGSIMFCWEIKDRETSV